MNQIKKFTLLTPANVPNGYDKPFNVALELPILYTVLKIDWDGDSICGWFLFDVEEEKFRTKFVFIGGDTDIEVPVAAASHLATIKGTYIIGKKEWTLGEMIHIFKESTLINSSFAS